MDTVETTELAAFLAGYPPFDSLDADGCAAVARGASVHRAADGDLLLDAFTEPSAEVFVVVEGQVRLWNERSHVGGEADEVLGAGGVFGYSSMLTERSVGPRAVAAGPVTVARIPEELAAPAFASRAGAAFLAGSARPTPSAIPTYSTVDELIVRPPLVVDPGVELAEVARQMVGRPAAVRLADGRYGLITDALLREKVLAEGVPASTPAGQVALGDAPTAVAGDSAAESLMVLLDRDAEFLLVTDRAGELRGVLAPRDFAISPTTAGVAVHEQLRRAGTVDELTRHAREVPSVLSDLLARGLASGRVIAVYSSMVDTIVRRAIRFVLAAHPELPPDAFTWLSLGSNGRREAVPSSDVDSAVAFDDGVPGAAVAAFRAAFAEVYRVLSDAGLTSDEHGATAAAAAFARTNAQWRAAGQQWLAAPADGKGAVLASLLVDGRPIHGDPGLPAVTRVFGDLRGHPGTMRLLLREALAQRARSGRHLFAPRPETFDVKEQALLPVVNLARWAALSVGSAVLPTTERLRAAAGSPMLSDGQAATLVEVFEVLQRLRLRYQLLQHRAGERPSDVLAMDRLSPIDRSVLAQAVREIAAAQRRVDNAATYVDTADW